LCIPQRCKIVSAAGVGIADKISRSMGNKDGIVKPVYEKAKGKFDDLFGGEESSSESKNSSMDSSSNGDSSQSTDSSKSQQNDSVQHDTPPSSNDTDSVSKNTERVNFVPLLLNILL